MRYSRHKSSVIHSFLFSDQMKQQQWALSHNSPGKIPRCFYFFIQAKVILQPQLPGVAWTIYWFNIQSPTRYMVRSPEAVAWISCLPVSFSSPSILPPLFSFSQSQDEWHVAGRTWVIKGWHKFFPVSEQPPFSEGMLTHHWPHHTNCHCELITWKRMASCPPVCPASLWELSLTTPPLSSLVQQAVGPHLDHW